MRWVRQHRVDLLSAVNAPVANWVRAGCPPGPTPFTPFPEWGWVVGGIHHGNGSAKGHATDSPVMRIGNDPALVPEPEPDPESPPGPEGSQLHVPDTGPTYVSRNVPSSRSHVRNGNRSLNLPPKTGQMALVPFCRPMKWPM